MTVVHLLHQHNRPLSTEIFISKKTLLSNTYSPLRDKYPEGGTHYFTTEASCFSTSARVRLIVTK